MLNRNVGLRVQRSNILVGFFIFVFAVSMAMPYAGVKADHDVGAPYEGEVLGKNNDGGTIDKIMICHATGSESNPYSNPEVNISSFFSGGHDTDLDDIIPPFHYTQGNGVESFAGMNWDTDQELWYNNCGVSTSPSPTPTPSISPDPTPSPSPSPSVSPSVSPDPTPSVSPDPTPSVSPDPTPSVSPSPSPTPDDDTSSSSGGGGGSFLRSPSPSPIVLGTTAPAPIVKGAELPQTSFTMLDRIMFSLFLAMTMTGLLSVMFGYGAMPKAVGKYIA